MKLRGRGKEGKGGYYLDNSNRFEWMEAVEKGVSLSTVFWTKSKLNKVERELSQNCQCHKHFSFLLGKRFFLLFLFLFPIM